MARYLLSEHSYVCVADEYAVFLDLRQDKYSALEPTDARMLSGIIEGWSAGAAHPAIGVPTQSEELVRMLLEERLLTHDERSGKAATPVSLLSPTLSLQMMSAGEVPRVNLGHLWRFFTAWGITTAALRFVPLRRIVERVRKRKAEKGIAERGFDKRAAFDLMMAYSILRPNFFSVVDACLRDSLTVIEFLARYDLFPTWVFGVRMNPFAAHSWVQEGSVVLNDTPSNVKSFTPIMTI